ncbi:rifin [Plasmodium sp. gorilla clade G1]|nr:rifin [Plasmodium sp. gorilla clade G1]
MKVHYINILLLALPLNILVSSPQNPCIILHTRINKPTKPHRLLCECELYTAQNYDNDLEIKRVMENFDRQTSQRFEEYNERMIKNRKRCKDKCDKDIQKIILRDKIEKELTEKFATLDTRITTNDIPTCVCEKSLADKVENQCLKCTQDLGGIVAPSSGVLGGIAELGLSAWKSTALNVAIAAAKKAGEAKGLVASTQAGIDTVMSGLQALGIDELGAKTLKSFFSTTLYTDVTNITQAVNKKFINTCLYVNNHADINKPLCTLVFEKNVIPGQPVSSHDTIKVAIQNMVSNANTAATQAAKTTSERVTATITNQKTSEIATICNGCHTTIIASIVAILVIVLVMVIIYLILRYRRKNKMKKKLQYIKLLKE